MLLKNKEEVTDKSVEIESWLEQNNIYDYELISDEKYGYIVNVNKDVNLFNRDLNSIEVKFNIVRGSFNCSFNKLKSLEGCPEIVNGNFDCSDNKLKDLIGGPKKIQTYYDCSFNELTSLQGLAVKVESLYCYRNQLSSLKYMSKKITENINISFNNLTMNELFYLPKNIQGIIEMHVNKELGELQKITNFNELKKILTIYQERERLDKLIKNNRNIKEKINKI